MRHAVTFPLTIEVDEIDNLACPASPVYDQHDPVQTTKTSVQALHCGDNAHALPYSASTALIRDRHARYP